MPSTLCALLVLLACNCAKPTGQFWIDGLSLPPGARVSSRQETTTSQYVAFDYPDDWEPVKAYFTDTFEPLGFHSAQGDEELELLQRRHPSWADAQLEQARAETEKQLATLTGIEHPKTALYVKRGSSYAVYFLKPEDTDPGRPAYAVFVTRGEQAAKAPAQSK